jgi:hypothetical protein
VQPKIGCALIEVTHPAFDANIGPHKGFYPASDVTKIPGVEAILDRCHLSGGKPH